MSWEELISQGWHCLPCVQEPDSSLQSACNSIAQRFSVAKQKTVLQTAERLCGEAELNLIHFNIVSGRKEGENLGLNPFAVRMYYGDFNYMIINNDPYSTSQNQPLSVFLLWSSYYDMVSALAPREKFHVWT